MKLKKLVCMTAAAAMVLSSASAFAADHPTDGLTNLDGAPLQGYVNDPVKNDWTAPVPVYNGDVTATWQGADDEAYREAQALYNQTFYFEAHVALEPVFTKISSGLGTPYQTAMVTDFMKQIEDAIDRVIIDEAFADVEAFMANGYYAEAADVLIKDVYSLSLYQPTQSSLTGVTGVSLTDASEQLYRPQSFTTADWNRARSLEAQIGAKIGDIVNSKDAAIRRVEFMYGELPSNCWYDVIEVGTRYDVYVQTLLPSGAVRTIGEVDIAKNGTILVDTFAAAGVVPNGPYNNPID